MTEISKALSIDFSPSGKKGLIDFLKNDPNVHNMSVTEYHQLTAVTFGLTEHNIARATLELRDGLPSRMQVFLITESDLGKMWTINVNSAAVLSLEQLIYDFLFFGFITESVDLKTAV